MLAAGGSELDAVSAFGFQLADAPPGFGSVERRRIRIEERVYKNAGGGQRAFGAFTPQGQCPVELAAPIAHRRDPQASHSLSS